jgi:AcrR family transcriptional regulator
MIIAKAGGSRRSIYQYFGGKEELFSAIIHNSCQEFMIVLDERKLLDMDPKTTLISIATQFLDFLMRPKTLALYRVVVGESIRFPELGKILYQAGPEVAYQKLSTYLKLQTKTGLINSYQPELNAKQFFEMVKGDLHFRALIIPDLKVSEKEIQENIHASVDLFLRGVAVDHH